MSVSTGNRLLAERYELGELLGSGGMADVYRAQDTRLQRQVAVKLFRAGSDASDTRRFDNEARALASLSHPGLVQVHDAGSSPDARFVVLELVEGRTLRDRIADGPLPAEDVRRLGAELADALAHVHARDMVHRDIKPSNILLDRDDHAHVADFGLARLVGSTRLTNADQLVGTAAYLAPEQVRGQEIHQAVDVYALGLVLLECLTGRREYEGSDIEAAVARLHRGPTVPDDLPEDLRQLLALMTSLTPRRRPTAAHCARVLRRPDQASTVIGPPVRSRPPVRPLAAAAALVLLAAGLTATLLNTPPPPIESAPPVTTSTAPSDSPSTPPVVPVQQPQQQTTAPVVPQVRTNTVADDAKPMDEDKSGKGKGQGKGNSGKG